jgi:hypothetical protein
VTLEALDRIATAVGRGLVAGVAATAAMTVSSTVEMRLRGRPPSAVPAKVAARLLDVEPSDLTGGRFPAIAHGVSGLGLGATRGLIDLAGLRGSPASLAFFAVSWSPDLVVVPAAGAAPPPWRWGVLETALSGLHHGVYAAAGDAVYRALAGSAGSFRGSGRG